MPKEEHPKRRPSINLYQSVDDDHPDLQSIQSIVANMNFSADWEGFRNDAVRIQPIFAKCQLKLDELELSVYVKIAIAIKNIHHSFYQQLNSLLIFTSYTNEVVEIKT